MNKPINHLISIAPMMDCTDRHYRRLMRLITRHPLLYSEMITTGAVIYGDRERLLGFNVEEHPVALQLGGSDPKALLTSAKIVEDYGYDEINLNVGCPSTRVQSGQFGACLMKQPELVAECFSAMRSTVSIPVTVKTRIGVDDQDSFEHLCHFISTVAEAGCETFILHARKAWLKGLSPKQNRSVPPLNYQRVYQLKKDFPQLTIMINGGIHTVDEAKMHLKQVDAVMLGRTAYHQPFILQALQQTFWDCSAERTREQVLEQFLPYAKERINSGVKLTNITRHLLGLFHGQPCAKHWRRTLSVQACLPGVDHEVIEKALKTMPHCER